MRANTLIMLLIAVVFGGIAVFFANVWLKNQSRPVQQATPAAVETSTIVVAARDLSFGEQLQPEVLREIPWPKASIPDGAFAKIADLTADGARLVLTPISPSEPVLKWKISGPGARASLSAIVTPGKRAVAIRINEVAGVAGFILAGDHVDVLYTTDLGTDILLQNVRVLAVERAADTKKSEPVLGNTATVEVNTLDAQKLALAQTTGSLSLTLRSAGSLDQAKAQRVVRQELVSSPSVYESVFDAQAAAQAALDARLKGLEGSLSQVAKKVEDSATSKAKLEAELANIEAKLKGEIANASAGSEALKSKLAALEEAVKQTAKATGQGEQALRAKLAALEAAIRQASSATGEGEDALRAKLAEFEANLRELANSSGRTVMVVPAVEQVAAAVELPTTVPVGVTRGMKRQAYEVPLDVTNR